MRTFTIKSAIKPVEESPVVQPVEIPKPVRKLSPFMQQLLDRRMNQEQQAVSVPPAEPAESAGDSYPPPSDAPADDRILWYHPESDSYLVGTIEDGTHELVNVTDDETHEATYADRTAPKPENEDLDQELLTRAALEGEIIPPAKDIALIDSGIDEDSETLSQEYQVDADHLRRAAASAAKLFNIMEGVNVTLDPSQVSAVHTLAREQYGCLIGAAGTGKTTTTRVLLHTLMNGDAKAGIEPLRISRVNLEAYFKAGREEYPEPDEADMERALETTIPSVALCAFTGQATQVLRKNLPPAWRSNAMTIHSMLGFAPEEYVKPDGMTSMRFVPTYTKHFKMPWDVIIVDEASMVNLELWHMVLDACKPGCRIYFIGDLNQLPPPFGYGILGFALGRWTVAELTTVHRQTDEAANRIIDTAHAILAGKPDRIVFDDPSENRNWRVIGFELPARADLAHEMVIKIAKVLSTKRVDASVDPATPIVYDPWRDRIMTPGNGYNVEEPGYQLGQGPLNDSLSIVFGDSEHARTIIDAKRVTKTFAVGYRVMATKNEPPDSVNRITNGLTGRITAIYENHQWLGDRGLVGTEQEVANERRRRTAEAILRMKNQGSESQPEGYKPEELTMESFQDAVARISEAAGKVDAKEKISGPASHIVEVEFDNGAHRVYRLAAEIEQLMIAYASTTNKAQGAEMPTAIIVVHHANKFHLCRENLYTAVTRARERVVILYTQHGIRLSLQKQKVSGKNLQEKIENYLRMSGGEDGTAFRTVNVRLTEND